MYKDYNMTQLTLLKETSVHIPHMICHNMRMILLKQFPILNSDRIVAQHYSIPI